VISDQGEGGDLPCLFSNNSIELENQGAKNNSSSDKLETVLALSSLLTPYRKRQAHTLFENVKRLIEKEAQSIDNVGFLTLTFPDNVTDSQDAYSHFRSMNTNFLSKWDEVKDWICVKERQKRGAWHYHLIVVFKGDLRTGVNFEEIEAGNYKSASRYLRGLWAELRARLPEYGFGRSELLPVKSNAEAMGRYVGKYISKHMGQKTEKDKGVRLVNYSRGWIRNSIRMAWYNKNSKEWRRKLQKFADYLGCTEFYQISEKLGPGWAYRYAEEIRMIDFSLLENGGEVSREYQERMNVNLQRKMEVRKIKDREKDSLFSEGKTDELREIRGELKKAADRKKKIGSHKANVEKILSQQWFTTDENIEEVLAEVHAEMKNSEKKRKEKEDSLEHQLLLAYKQNKLVRQIELRLEKLPEDSFYRKTQKQKGVPF
jgi:hypothetical protein